MNISSILPTIASATLAYIPAEPGDGVAQAELNRIAYEVFGSLNGVSSFRVPTLFQNLPPCKKYEAQCDIMGPGDYCGVKVPVCVERQESPKPEAVPTVGPTPY